MRVQIIRQHYAKIVIYFMSSLAGLVVDLFMFQLLTHAHTPIFFSNLISASLAIITGYFCLTHLFQLKAHLGTFSIFFVYYTCSITCFSFGIAYATHLGHAPAIVYKILSLPFSFIINGCFSNFILGRKIT